MGPDILEVLWTNVDWHRKNKRLNWSELVGRNSALAYRKKLNPTAIEIQEIASKLDITDYAILFEEIEFIRGD